MKRKFFKFLSFFIASILAVLGFTGCNDDDIRPEYGVPVSRNVPEQNISLNNDDKVDNMILSNQERWEIRDNNEL